MKYGSKKFRGVCDSTPCYWFIPCEKPAKDLLIHQPGESLDDVVLECGARDGVIDSRALVEFMAYLLTKVAQHLTKI